MKNMPVFVKIEDYGSVLTLVDNVRAKLEDAKKTLLKINDLKNEEDHLLEQWQSGLIDIEKKIEFINQSFSEPENY
jgi:hypothetical protein